VKEALTAAHEYARSVSWLTSATQELATLDGLARFLWVCLRKHHPGLTDSEVRGLIMGDPAGVVGAMDMFDLLHNTGPAAKKNGPAKGRMASQRGGTSTRRRKSTRH
jgi:streptomycin 6-kinase